MKPMAQKPQRPNILGQVVGGFVIVVIFTLVIGQAVIRGNPELWSVAIPLTCAPGVLWMIITAVMYSNWKKSRLR